MIYFLDGDGVANSNQDPEDVNFFSINTTSGQFYVLQPLERDGPQGQEVWSLKTFAQRVRDRKILGDADILVHVRDINDNAPVFTHSVYHASISENSTVGQHVIQVTAIDADDPNEGGNGLVTYTIDQNQVNEQEQEIFGVDPKLGTINTLVCCLDRESKDNYSIVVTAIDGGGLKVMHLIRLCNP